MPFSTARLTMIAAFSMTSSSDRPDGRARRSSSACFSASAASCAFIALDAFSPSTLAIFAISSLALSMFVMMSLRG
jgi:hypothetical protein